MPIITTASAIVFGTWLLEKIKDKGFDKLTSLLEKSNSINDKFSKAISVVSTKLHDKYPFILGGRMDYFFKNEHVYKELIKLIFVNSIVDINLISNSFDIDTLPDDFILEFVSELKLELLKDQELENIISDKELFILISGITNDVDLIANNSNLSLHEITKIKELIQERIGEKFVYNDFYDIYKENALNNLSQVNFIGLGVGVDISKKINRKNLQDVFVKPIFKISQEEKYHGDSFEEVDENSYQDRNIDDEMITDFNEEGGFKNLKDYGDLFNEFKKIVVLGKPGSGKSILIKSIICSILEGKTVEFENKEITKHIPFRIELRKYLASKKQNRGNVLKYLNSSLEEEFGISNITEKILHKILLEKDNIIFFDGLDEIFNIEDKIEIKNDIENFHHSYPLTKSLTTSRIIGYDEAKFNDVEFQELEILNFEMNQIREYLEKWYEKEEENKEIRGNEISGFLGKIHEIDNELISNPLLLSLIVIIYRNTLALPESKLEIYQSCTKTLVEKWDASKKELEINLEASIYKKRENILADLAYWQYQQLSSETISITYEKALNAISITLEKLKIADETDSYNMSEAFMEYARKRSIYFENNFTHKTFLEYYTAFWIYSNFEKKNKTEERNKLIEKYINNPFWHIVLELLLNMIDKNQADNEMMDELIIHQIKKDKHSLPFLLSTVNSFKNVSDECLVFVINNSIDFLLDNYKIENFPDEETEVETLHSRIYHNIRQLYGIPNNKIKIINKFIEVEKNSSEISLLNYSLYVEIIIYNNYESNNDVNFAFELNNYELFRESILKSKFLFFSHLFHFNKKINISEITKELKIYIDNFGESELYNGARWPFEGGTYISIFSFYFRNQLSPTNIESLRENLKQLFDHGLNQNSLISNLVGKELYLHYGSDDTAIVILLDIFEKEEQHIFSVILMILIFKIIRNKLNFPELIKNNKFRETLSQVYFTHQNSRYQKILEIYDYKLINK